MSIFSLHKPFLTKDTKQFVDDQKSKKAPPPETLSPDDARRNLIAAQSGNVKKCPADIQDVSWPGGPTGSVSVRLIKPEGARDRLPAILYIHGGGWVTGNKITHDRLVRLLASEVGAAVIFVEYALSPEAKYPVALEQCYAALEYAGKNAAELGLDPDGFIIAGDSAGGNMAAVLAMMAKERGGPKVIFQMLFYPVTDFNFHTQSYKDFSDGPHLTKKMMENFRDAYLPESSRGKERNASPLQASEEDLTGLPPALIITAENDVLRDEGEEYAKRLDAANVRVSCVRMLGTIHDFVMVDALADTEPAKTAICLAVAEMKKAFQTMFPESEFARAVAPEPVHV